MTTREELPRPGDEQSPDDHRKMSLRFLDHAERELRARRRLQASEKTWGVITHQLSAIAEQLDGYMRAMETSAL